MVGLNHSSVHAHQSSCDKKTAAKSCHDHQGYEDVHHDNHFHIGVFHFLGHLFEDIGHQDDLGCNHVAPAHKLAAKKVLDSNKDITFGFNPTDNKILIPDASSLSSPPFYGALSQLSTHLAPPLRGPPTLL